MAQERLVLTESELASLEKAKADKEAHGEFDTACPARNYGYLPKVCRPYPAKTKGRVERPFRYIPEDFFLGRSFCNVDHLNSQFGQWLDWSPMCASVPPQGECCFGHSVRVSLSSNVRAYVARATKRWFG